MSILNTLNARPVYLILYYLEEEEREDLVRNIPVLRPYLEQFKKSSLAASLIGKHYSIISTSPLPLVVQLLDPTSALLLGELHMNAKHLERNSHILSLIYSGGPVWIEGRSATYHFVGELVKQAEVHTWEDPQMAEALLSKVRVYNKKSDTLRIAAKRYFESQKKEDALKCIDAMDAIRISHLNGVARAALAAAPLKALHVIMYLAPKRMEECEAGLKALYDTYHTPRETKLVASLEESRKTGHKPIAVAGKSHVTSQAAGRTLGLLERRHISYLSLVPRE
ncbi:MAG: hypothetical protein ACKVOH_02360 [Chlamydiales bacterium]